MSTNNHPHLLDGLNSAVYAIAPLSVWQAGEVRAKEDILAEEVPVALTYNGISHVVLMTTPSDLAELALGFSLSEGILNKPSEAYDIEVNEVCGGVEVQMNIATARFQALKEHRRNLSGRTGCGLCGVDSLAAIQPQLPQVVRTSKVQSADIQVALQQFSQHQPLRACAGSVHAAAWVENGQIQHAFEDVGRHNALDKLLGHGARAGCDWQQGFALISSRASYEMIAKAAKLGVGCLVAVSAPTALAVRLAEQAGITLIGFAHPNKMSIYSHPEWLE